MWREVQLAVTVSLTGALRRIHGTQGSTTVLVTVFAPRPKVDANEVVNRQDVRRLHLWCILGHWKRDGEGR